MKNIKSTSKTVSSNNGKFVPSLIGKGASEQTTLAANSAATATAAPITPAFLREQMTNAAIFAAETAHQNSSPDTPGLRTLSAQFAARYNLLAGQKALRKEAAIARGMETP